ncbi:MAG: bifunctional [glutamine synthetase] adenylyltransferase/[glutamine synthetase]-adenylyl-L-tyrosine phosphorylase [Actinomycetes bacterium]
MSPREVSTRARLVAAGLDGELALRRLATCGLWEDTEPDPVVLDLVSRATDPDDAFATVTDLAAADPALYAEVRADEDWLRRVVAVAGTSRPLGDLLARYPSATRSLQRVGEVTAPLVAHQVEQAVVAADEPDQAAAIAEIRRRMTADIAARDLTGAVDVEQVARELAALAEGVLSGALAAVHRQVVGGDAPAARIGVVGMGKLGGHELNYVSDVDVMFVHAPVEGADDAVATREATQVCTRLLALCNASTTMGRAYEVDPTLRPEGRAGALSRTVGSFVAYWDRWAKTWEFQALLKARAVGGDRALVAELLDEASRFVWPDDLDPGVVAEIREMKGRVEAKPEVVRHGDRQVKLGPGGLRDIEFAVQLLQLVHGRLDTALRITGTLPALDALARGGYVADEDAATFADAYRLLRTVEHRLQLANERRTHTIPDDDDRQEWLARSLGFRANGEATARAPFLRELRRVQGQVRELHAKLFYRPLLESHAVVSRDVGDVTRPDAVRALGEEAALERLRLLGFRDARAALRDVRALTGGFSRKARTMQAILPALLADLAEAPDPDTGLRMLRTLVDAQGPNAELVGHLRDVPPAATLLARVLGTSEVAGELLLAHPQGIEWLTDRDVLTQSRSRAETVKLALGRLEWQDTTAALRRFKRHELLRIVLRDLDGAVSITTVGEELANLADACLEAALVAATDEVTRERGLDAPAARLVVLGMGRYGGRELSYVSDLDVIFVHAPTDGVDDRDANAFAIAVAERVVSSLGRITAEGTAFEVDVDLRPEGRNGPLSRSITSMAAYHDRWAEPWEHQAALKARVAAGDRALGDRLFDLLRPHTYPQAFSEADAVAMRKMKARIERERLPRRGDPQRHLKLGPGGLSDVEWVVQLLQRRHGAAVPMVRSASTATAIDALEDAELLGHRDADWLREGYRFLSRVRNALYLLRQRNVDVLPTQPDVLERLARSVGYGRGRRMELEEDFLRHARHVRAVTERVFYGMEHTVSRDDATWGRSSREPWGRS